MADSELTEAQIGEVTSWAVRFNGMRPADGSLTNDIIERAGPIPVPGTPARAVALEYFQSKLPAARTRLKVAQQQPDKSATPKDWFNAVDYWNRVISWFSGLED